ncbi:hypothetical protein AB2B38_003030 [Balneola sp. MJW-20]|uniref:hypothetical protein n=1 Tax=Gracilimonas aurantiaca TaxID=3234185 RepID=UPI0034669D7A
MKSMVNLFLLMPLLCSCTVVGLVFDSASNFKRQKAADSIREPGQEIVLEKKDGTELKGTFREFGYLEESLVGPESKSGTYFPQINDSVAIVMDNDQVFEGIFAGIIHTKKHNDLILKPYWATRRVNYIEQSKVKKISYLNLKEVKTISDPGWTFFLDRPVEEHILIHIDPHRMSEPIALSEVNHLDNKSVKNKYYATLVGFGLDALVAILFFTTADMCCNASY